MNEMEAALVGRCITDAEALHGLRIRPEHLSDTFLRVVLKNALEVASRGADVNLLSLADASKTISERAGDLAALTTAAAVGNVGYYEDKIIESYRRREIAKLGREMVELDGDSSEILGWIDLRLEEITGMTERDRVYSQRELLPMAIEHIEARYKAGGELPGLATGFDNLDQMIMGLRDRMLHYVAARPSQGKSAIMLQMALHISRQHPIGFISMESGGIELTVRNLANEGMINATALNTGSLDVAQFAQLTATVERMKERPFFVYDAPNATLDRVVSVARLMHRRNGIRALFVDYLQIITVPGNYSKREKVEAASLRLKQLARELDIPVICGAQAKREDGIRPNLESFQHADQAGQDADVAIFLYPKDDVTWAIVEKNRDGAKGDVALHFQPRFVRFEEAKDDLPTF